MSSSPTDPVPAKGGGFRRLIVIRFFLILLIVYMDRVNPAMAMLSAGEKGGQGHAYS